VCIPMVEKKSSKLILVNPPILKGSFRHQLYLPMGSAYLASFLEEKGHEVKVIDCQATEIRNRQF
jgi:hypothetical protein